MSTSRGVEVRGHEIPQKEIRDLKSQVLYLEWEKHNLVTALLDCHAQMTQKDIIIDGYRRQIKALTALAAPRARRASGGRR